MDRAQSDKIRQAIVKILQEYNILSVESFETMDEDTGCELYENLKAGVLEEFNLEEVEMDKILEEILQAL